MMKRTHREQRPAGGSASVLTLAHECKVQLLGKRSHEVRASFDSQYSTCDVVLKPTS